MIGDALVFDGVAHPFNFEADNARGPAGQMFSNHLYAFHTVLTPPGLPLMSAEEFLHKWSVEEIHEMVYENSDTDMLVAMPLPLTDLYKDGLSPWTECAKLAQLDPDRTVMWGTVNPLEGKAALDDVTRQVEEYGARRSSSTTCATRTAARCRGGWTTRRSRSRSSSGSRSWA